MKINEIPVIIIKYIQVIVELNSKNKTYCLIYTHVLRNKIK